MNIDKDLLIASVFERTPIWDKRHKLHYNRPVIQNYWEEISALMKVDEAKLKKMWKYLRDQFAVESGKVLSLSSGDSADIKITPKWPYFTQLLFLREVVKPRPTTGRRTQSSYATYRDDSAQDSGDSEGSAKDAYETIEPECIADIEDITYASSSSNSTLSPKATKKRRGKEGSYEDSILETKSRKKLKRHAATDEEDEHFSFFKSLLPHVRKIPENKILSFRCRVQELVDEFSYQNLASSTPT